MHYYLVLLELTQGIIQYRQSINAYYQGLKIKIILPSCLLKFTAKIAIGQTHFVKFLIKPNHEFHTMYKQSVLTGSDFYSKA